MANYPSIERIALKNSKNLIKLIIYEVTQNSVNLKPIKAQLFGKYYC